MNVGIAHPAHIQTCSYNFRLTPWFTPRMNNTWRPRYLFLWVHVGSQGQAHTQENAHTVNTRRKPASLTYEAWPCTRLTHTNTNRCLLHTQHICKRIYSRENPMRALVEDAHVDTQWQTKPTHIQRVPWRQGWGLKWALLAIRWAAVQRCGWKPNIRSPALLVWVCVLIYASCVLFCLKGTC